MSSRTKLILGLAGAAAAGVIVGILLAPDSGSATRGKIASTTGDWASHLGDLFASAKDSVKGEANRLRKKGVKVASDVADRYADVKESYS